MDEKEKKHGFTDIIKDALSFISQIIASSVFPKIAEGAEMIMNDIDNRILRIEKRIMRKIISLLVIGFGGVFLIFAIFFSLKEFLGWSNSAACFSIGITIFVIGLLLKIGTTER